MKYRKKPIIIEAYQTDVELDIETLEGVMHANIGDYIITGINGEKYPCKPNIFEKTYEPVEENNYKMDKALEALEELTVVLKTSLGTKQYSDIFEIHLIKPIETALKSLKTFEELGIDLTKEEL